MRVIIEIDGQTGAPAVLAAAAGISGGSPSAALLGNLGMSIGEIAASVTTYDAGPPSPDLVAAIAHAAPSPLHRSASEGINGGPSPAA